MSRTRNLFSGSSRTRCPRDTRGVVLCEQGLTGSRVCGLAHREHLTLNQKLPCLQQQDDAPSRGRHWVIDSMCWMNKSKLGVSWDVAYLLTTLRAQGLCEAGARAGLSAAPHQGVHRAESAGCV